VPRGGKRTGAGRKVGAVTKATADIKALAGQYTEAALAELGRLASNAQSEAARVAAIKELLDRGHGKSAQSLEVSGKDGGPLQVHVIKFTGD
jgi:hypothetical protein